MLSSICFIFAGTCPSAHLVSMVAEQQALSVVAYQRDGQSHVLRVPSYRNGLPFLGFQATALLLLPFSLSTLLLLCFFSSSWLQNRSYPQGIDIKFLLFLLRYSLENWKHPSLFLQFWPLWRRPDHMSSSNYLQALITKCLLCISRIRYGAGLLEGTSRRAESYFSQFGASYKHS